MGKLIAVWGSPDSGKTTFSVKLAEALYNRSRGKSAVIVVFTDIVTPTIPVIFPNFRSEDVFSVGTILTKPDFFADDVVSNMVMTKDRMNLGYLGYKDSENKHSFPDYTEEKAKYLYREPVAVDGKYVMSRPTIYAMAGDAFGVYVEYEITIPFELFNRKITDITVPITIVSQFKQK